MHSGKADRTKRLAFGWEGLGVGEGVEWGFDSSAQRRMEIVGIVPLSTPIPAAREGRVGLADEKRVQDVTQVTNPCVGAEQKMRGGCQVGNRAKRVLCGAFSHVFNAGGQRQQSYW